MHFLNIIFWSIEYLLLFYFGFTSVYSFLLSLAGVFPSRLNGKVYSSINKIAILIPAYKEDSVIINTVKKTLEQDYPPDKFSVYVIADQLKEDTLVELRQLSINLIEVNFESSTKVKALNKAFKNISVDFQIGIVLDADNLMESSFLREVNRYFNNGYRSLQGQRMPKNQDSQMSFLDGLSEAINNHIVRKGTCNLGGSSAIVGSGFAVEYSLLKSTLLKMKSVGGFDKELEIELLKRRIKTIYVENLILFDEKVSNTKDFKNQRKRWIASQFFYLRKYLGESIRSVFNGNWALFNSAFLRYAQLPRFINTVILILVSVFFIGFHQISSAPWWMWILIDGMTILSILMAIPSAYYNKRLLKAILSLPQTFFVMFLLLFKLKGANKKFIHTPHSNQRAD